MRLLLSLFCVLTVLALRADAFLPAVISGSGVDITAGLVALWDHDDGSGTTADEPISNFDGTLEGFAATPPWTASGLTYDGSNDVVRIIGSGVAAHGLDFTAGPFSITGRFVYNGDGGTIFGKRDGALIQYQFTIETGANTITFRGGNERGTIPGPIGGWVNGVEYNVAVVVDSAENPEMYLDCVQGTWTDVDGLRPHVFTQQIGVEAAIGARFSTAPSLADLIAAEIREVRVYNIAISQAVLGGICALPN